MNNNIQEHAKVQSEKRYTEEDMKNIVLQFADECEHNEELTQYYGRDDTGEKVLATACKWIMDYLNSNF